MLTNILYAFLLVTGIGFLASVLLSLVSRFFAVKKNEREEKIREILPGANCGACGYSGCNDYAKYLANGGNAVNLCLLGGSETAKKLAELLGSAPLLDVEQKAALVRCNGSCSAVKTDYVYDGVKTCSAAVSFYGGPYACKFGCLGYGDCASVCPTGAICVENGMARINAAICQGCGKCASVCPKKLITVLPLTARTGVLCSNTNKGADARRACKNACIGCKKCEKVCAPGAIKVHNNLASVNNMICTGCKQCVEVCPVHCLTTIFNEIQR